MLRTLSLTLAVLLGASSAHSQLRPLPQDEGTSGLGLALRRLPTSGSVLYVTAHPDDEDNGVLVHLGRGRGLDTALLTLTRGDGGQNEIGPELFEGLGILRSEELAAVHRYDGAQQYFTRAYEFGYSYSVEETFEKWGREEILRDVVRVVRAVRPDVILTLPLESPGGGQHHQAAGRLAVEAFRAAADPTRFPEQVDEGLLPWQARKVYQGGVGGGNEVDKEGRTVAVDTSTYDPLLGMSAHQFGMLARSSHKCQGMGQLRAMPGVGRAAYSLVDAEPEVAAAEQDLLAGVDTSLSGLLRFAPRHGSTAPMLAGHLRRIDDQARQAQEAYATGATDRLRTTLRAGLAGVVETTSLVGSSGLDASARHELLTRLRAKQDDFEDALTLAHGLAVEPLADDGDVVPGQAFTVTLRVFNRGEEPVGLSDVSLRVPSGWTATRQSAPLSSLGPGQGAEVAFSVTVAPAARYSQPYWRRSPEVDRYVLEVPAHQTLPWSPPDVIAAVTYTSHAPSPLPVTVEAPVFWRYPGPWVGGEKQKVVNVVPALSVHLTPGIAVMPTPGAARREFRVRVLGGAKTASEAVVGLEAPAGWTVEPPEARVALRFEGEEATSRFFVTAPAGTPAGEYTVRAVARVGGREFREGYQVIAYDHIQERHLFHPAASRVQVIEAAVSPGIAIGYVAGAGDEVPAAMTQLGVEPTFLTPDDLAYGDLSRFSTIVTGIRAYQTRNDLRANNHRLLDYARAGGHLLVQYNKFDFNRLGEAPAGAFSGAQAADVVSPFAPYPAAVTYNRVTLEDAPVRVLVPSHPFFTTPNRITAADFEGWVQERGLYFLGARDPSYVELLSSSDPFPRNPGEKKGMLVSAPVGKGAWTYVGLGLFRQLPAGTPGAYRLLANLLSRPRGR